MITGPDVDGCDIGSSEDESKVNSTGDVMGHDDSIPTNDAPGCHNDVPVFDYVKSSRVMSQMLKYSTKYIVRSMLCDDGRVSVNVSWLTRSYHKHTIKPGVAGCLVAQHGVMEVGI